MATETLRPNAAGDETNIVYQQPDSTFHWDKVDEETADGDLTRVHCWHETSWARDLYNLPAHSVGSGTINKITLYFTVKGYPDKNTAKGAIKSNTTITETAEKNPYADFGSGSYGEYSQEWATNPAPPGTDAWTWDDIDALQIGISIVTDATHTTHCTQVYVVVDYTPGGQDYPISLSPGLTAGVSIDREVAWDRATSPGLTASATVDREVTYTRATSPGLTAAVSIVKGWGRAIATSCGLTISATVAKSLGRKITTSPGLTISATVNRVLSYNRATQPALSVAVTVIKGWGRTIITSAGLTASATVDREVAWGRATTPGLTVAVTIIKSFGKLITTSTALAISTTIIMIFNERVRKLRPFTGRALQIFTGRNLADTTNRDLSDVEHRDLSDQDDERNLQ